MNKQPKTPVEQRATLEAIRASALANLPARFAQLRAELASGVRS